MTNDLHEQPLDELIRLCQTGTAEGEASILSSLYIVTERFDQLISPPSGSPRLIIGKKGTGKTAFIDFSSKLLNNSGTHALTLKPSDIKFGDLPTSTALGDLTGHAEGQLFNAIGVKIGTDLCGFLTGDSRALYNLAISNGSRQKDFIGYIADLCSELAKPVSFGKIEKLMPEASNYPILYIENSIKRSLNSDMVGFFIFIDDTDQVAAPGVIGHLNRIWSLLLASRNICQRIPQIKIYVSLREEVWRRLLRDEAGQRDQIDQFQPLVEELNPSQKDVSAILQRRIEEAANNCSATASKEPYSIFFAESKGQIPTTEKLRKWEELIVRRSRGRPRDAIQLLRHLAQYAKEKKQTKILSTDFPPVMANFSRNIVDLLSVELTYECPQIVEIVNSFALAEKSDSETFIFTPDDALKHMLTLPSRTSIQLFGIQLKPDNRTHAYTLWQFLFDMRIFNARVSDSDEPDNYRHLDPKERPRLVTEANWNELQSMLWEIDPAYRDHLLSIRADRGKRVGTPARKKRR